MTLSAKEMNVGLRGPKPRSVEEHIARGSYRPSRHGPKPQPAKAEWENYRKMILRLPDGSPWSRPLGPLEQELKDLGIEVTDEDRRKKGPEKP